MPCRFLVMYVTCDGMCIPIERRIPQVNCGMCIRIEVRILQVNCAAGMCIPIEGRIPQVNCAAGMCIQIEGRILQAIQIKGRVLDQGKQNEHVLLELGTDRLSGTHGTVQMDLDASEVRDCTGR
ncbi:unnamed protein product [Sphagnum jensenii]